MMEEEPTLRCVPCDLQSTFECITCDFLASTGQELRVHYKNDHHRYNCRRRVKGLAPLSFEQFQIRKRRAEGLMRAEQHVSETDQSLKCDICRKRFSTRNAMEQHLSSKKHAAMVKKKSKKNKNNNKNKNKNKNKSKSKNTTKKHKQPASTSTDEVAAASTGDNNSAESVPDEKSVSADPGPATQFASADPGPATQSASADPGPATQSKGASVPSSRRAIPVDTCLFSNHRSDSMESNLEYMRVKHSFIIPFEDKLKDREGLLAYLGRKVGLGHLCIYCHSERGFKSLQACQSHMVDSGHCKMSMDCNFDFSEYAPFYGLKTVDGVTEDFSGAVLEEDEGGELLLPDGRRIGNRMYKRYYNQVYKPVDERDEVRAELQSLADRYTSTGALSLKDIGGKGRSAVDLTTMTVKAIQSVRRGQLAQARASVVQARAKQNLNGTKNTLNRANKLNGLVMGGNHATFTQCR